ncbi:MAG TPA: hypothetical protein VFR81_02265 [Longimicrobium sp.]|nr:hypothetical protein [Longimicrobium sp.]
MALARFHRVSTRSPPREMAEIQNRVRHRFTGPLLLMRPVTEPAGWSPAEVKIGVPAITLSGAEEARGRGIGMAG